MTNFPIELDNSKNCFEIVKGIMEINKNLGLMKFVAKGVINIFFCKSCYSVTCSLTTKADKFN